jgi:WS/DGAT/MGAT family acyltransferase
MPTNTYDRLSFLDSVFLIMETPTSPMHIAGCATFAAGPLRTAEGGIDIDRIRDYVESRLHLIPRYRQRLAHTPIGQHPVWVDDAHFNIDYHVRHSALPKPGDARQLKRLAARLIAQHLDRQKPLWEIWILEGLADPAHFVMISKVHHCMVDGMSSVDLLKVLLTLEPTRAFEPPSRWLPRPAPSRWRLAIDAVERYARLPLDIVTSLPRIWLGASDASSAFRAALNVVRDSFGTGLRVSDTPLNQRIGPHRRLDWVTMDLAAVKAVKKRLGGTVNDIVLATVAGAVRRFLKRRGVDVASIDFRVMAPVSVRTENHQDTLGNQVSGWTVSMPIHERDPLRRLEAIRTTTEHLKDSKQALGAAALTQVGEWTPSTLLALGARLAVTAIPFNLIVTNVPGPQLPLYMLGARMVDNFGFIPLVDGLCLGVVLFSYAGKLCWGFTGDWDVVPDIHDFAGDIETSFRELRAISERTGSGVAPRTSALRLPRPDAARSPRGKRSRNVAKMNKAEKPISQRVHG